MTRARFLKPLSLLPLLFVALWSKADTAVLWQDLSATLTQGHHFKVDPAEQNALTLEHTSALSTGDSFAFIEASQYPHVDRSAGLYGEVAIRWSHNKIASTPITFGPITDVLLTTNLEFGSETAEMLLLGPSIDLLIPGFDFFQLSLTRRESLNSVVNTSSEGWQLTPSFSLTWPAGRSEVVLDGFIDWVQLTSRGTQKTCKSTLNLSTTLASCCIDPTHAFMSVSNITFGPISLASLIRPLSILISTP